jgi:hypothetical protein
MGRYTRVPLVLLSVLMGCDSQLNLTAQPARQPVEAAAGVRAIVTATPFGQSVTIDNPATLPEAIRAARDLKVAVGGGTLIPVTRQAGGYYTFVLPSNARVTQDVSGNMRVTFVMDERQSQIVALNTGSPITFQTPAILTEPAPAFLVRGLDATLTANTTADEQAYQFNWFYSTTGTAPWVSIPGEGKKVRFTPPQSGNYHIKLDTVDRKTQLSYSTVTPTALILVTDGENVISTTPSGGNIERGTAVTLNFNRPNGLKGDALKWSWGYAANPGGPFSTIAGDTATTTWLPTGLGAFFIRAEVSNPATGEVNTFVTPRAAVFVNEGRPIVTVNPQSVRRGDLVTLQFNVANPNNRPLNWYVSRQTGPAPSWSLIPGATNTNTLIVNESGSYHFRVDMPDDNGNLRSFTTTDPVLGVTETEPLLQSVPLNQVVNPGSSVTLQLNARGVNESEFQLTWYVSNNPLLGAWTALPFKKARDASKKTFEWETNVATTRAGSYFVRVDAARRDGTAVYTFTSSGPVVTVEN